MEININAVINGVFVLLGVSLGFFLQLISNKSSEKKMLKKEFNTLKEEIYYERETNKLDYRLDRLRHFFIYNHELLKREANNNFFEKWLENPASNWDNNRIDDMENDLDKTRV